MSAAPSVPTTGGTPEKGGSWVKWLVVAQLIYWGLFAAVAPVTNYDSQVYNLARLAIAHVGGLFNNPGWNTPRQVAFPWTFDAVHYPFLFVHWGYCLPSFSCFVGILMIVHRLVTAATNSTRHGWWCCLALLALPTLVYQAVCTKNDIPVVFGVGCWFYAWRLWREEQRGMYLFFMALALGFSAGAKSTGLLFAGVLSVYTACQLRTDRLALTRFAAWMVVCMFLFGSVEIYLNNQRLYHAPLGPRGFVTEHQNRDGLAGAAASFIRYCFGNMSVGIDTANPASPLAGGLENACRDFLRFVGLGRNLGYRSGYNETDENMQFLKSGLASGSDFGPVGALALISGFIFLLARPPSDVLWKLSAAAIAALALISYTVAWMMWNARFLLLPFSLLTIALALWVLRLGDHNFGRFVRSAFLLLAVFSAVIYAWCSYNQNPAGLWRAIRHRPAAEMSERMGMLQIVKDLRTRANSKEPPILLVQAAGDSWLLCIMEVSGLRTVPTPVITAQILAANRPHAGHAPIYALTINSPLWPVAGPNLIPVKNYSEPQSALYQWQPPAAPTP